MMDDTVYRLLADTDDGVMQILIYLIVGAFVVLGNISKARAEQKRKRNARTGDNRPRPKPTDQPSHARASRSEPHVQEDETSPSPSTEPPPKPRPRHHVPGGFAEALLDEALEKTLTNRASRNAIMRGDDDETIPVRKTPQIVPAIQDADEPAIADNLDQMGHLETLEHHGFARGVQEDSGEYGPADLISFESSDDLARGIVFAEILSRPVGLRKNLRDVSM